jgi:hypothetical protein
MAFAVVRMAKVVAGISSGAGYSIYALCRLCGRQLERHGPTSIPNPVRDPELATLLRFAPAKGTA